MTITPPVKRCTHCLQWKPATREYFGGTGTGTGNLRGKCRECAREYDRQFEANNKDKRKQRDARRASTGENARKPFDPSIKVHLYKKQHGFCLCCGKQIDTAQNAEVDHAIPLSRGGLDEDFNLWLVHSKCNREKHNKTLREHWEWRVNNGLDQQNVGIKTGLIDLCEEIERKHQIRNKD